MDDNARTVREYRAAAGTAPGQVFRTAAGVRHTIQQLDETGSARDRFNPMILAHPANIDGLQTILRTVAERSRLGQPVRALRPLSLLCPGERRHVIGRVYSVPGGVGPVLVASAPDWHNSGQMESAHGWTTFTDPDTGQEIEVEVDESVQKLEMVHRFETFAAVLNEQGPHDRWVAIECRCRTVDVTVSMLRELLDAGQPRVRI